jgi:N-acetylglucosaminyldiphosphoundecaprenol N-acetyl-beta-D-mannosaminyltransferase
MIKSMLVLEKKEPYSVLGVDISPYSRDEFYELIESRLKDNVPVTPPVFVITVNPEIVIQSIVDNEFKHILTSSSINTADGVGISWAIEFLYNKHVDRITGSDSLENICALCSKHHESAFLYGAMPTVAEKAAEKLQSRIESFNISGTYSPEKPDIRLEDLPDDKREQLQNASVVFVALGAPAQEKWINENLPKLPNCKLIIGIGGTFDFISGNVTRAPEWLRKSGLEWFYRLFSEPGRWRRMLKLPLFALNVLILKVSNKY